MKIFRHVFFLAALPVLLVAACAGNAPARPEPPSMPKSVPAPPVAAVRPHVVESPNGNRADLMQKLVDMKPGFLRFPGGNYLEGETVATRFKWKETLGALDQRPGHRGTWGYRSSDGMGLLEFLEWCEDMKAEPVLAVFAGYALHGETIPGGPALQPFVQEALDEIEYVTGDVSTKWGAQRAKDGHPAPFKLRYVEIGNEDGFDKQKTYDGRYTQFHDAIKAKYPQLKLISTVNGKDWLSQLQHQERRSFGRGNYEPDIRLMYWSMRVMAMLGVAMFLIAAVGAWFYRRGTLEKRRWFLWIGVIAIAFPYIAATAGWILTEMGRQPWIVQGLLKTSAAVSTGLGTTTIAASLAVFLALYTALGIVDFVLMRRYARVDPPDLPVPGGPRPAAREALT